MASFDGCPEVFHALLSVGVEGQPDENVREVHFLSGQTSKENEDFVYSFR